MKLFLIQRQDLSRFRYHIFPKEKAGLYISQGWSIHAPWSDTKYVILKKVLRK